MYFLHDGSLEKEKQLGLALKNEWKKEKNKNMLIITGLSGSGKTTLANKIVENRNDIIIVHMDKFILNGKGSRYIEEWYENKGSEYKNKDWYGKDVYKTECYFDAFIKFFDDLLKDAKEDEDKLYLVEGIQLYYPKMIEKINEMENKNIVVIKRTKTEILKNFVERNKNIVEEKSIEEVLKMIEGNLKWNERNEQNYLKLLETLERREKEK